MKISRLGMTESGLLISYFAYTHSAIDDKLKQQAKDRMPGLLQWLYTTSGYYDTTVKGSNFDFSQDALTSNVERFIQHLAISLRGSEEAQLFVHEGLYMKLLEAVKSSMSEFYGISKIRVLNGTVFYHRLPEFYTRMAGKRILVVSPFSELVTAQVESGNVYKLGIGFPKIESVATVTPPYCFCNNGPNSNYFETLDLIFDEIKKTDFDLALLGCGAYGHMLTHRIHSELQRDAIYVGGSTPSLFGILGRREKKFGLGKDAVTNVYWVLDIPEKFRPSQAGAVENGCYW